jgi:probable phosphoglycerate mutase
MCCALDTSHVVGIAADHGGYELKQYLIKTLRAAGAVVVDFGDSLLDPDDDYPDFVVPLARAVVSGQVKRGVAICGSGVGACIAANKIPGVRACLIHDPFSAHQGVEDDDMNLICLGGLVVGHALAWELVRRFLVSQFSGKERHRRRLEKVTHLENHPFPNTISSAEKAGVTNETSTLRLYLIRHGETEWSLSGQYTGRADIPLTAYGEAAARKVGERLKNISFAHVLMSPLQRARQTCALAALETTPEIEPNLTEWDNGDYESQTPEEIREVRPEWNLFRDGAPNGETPAQISERVDSLIAYLRTLGGNVALFSHSHLCRVLAARWIGLSVEQAERFLLNTAAISILSYAHDRSDEQAIALWNSEADEFSNPAPLLEPHK